MAKQKKEAESVSMTSPRGTKVTVAKASQDTYTGRGYKAASAK